VRSLLATKKLTPPQDKRQESVVNSTDTDQSPSDHEVRVKDGSNAPSIPQEYHKWISLFEEGDTADSLPPHRPWDHKIPLLPGKTPPFGPLYPKSGKELEAERKYIDKMLKKGWIEKSTSPAASPLFFVPKKNGELRGVVDFRKINEITIKNRYPLPNIMEMRDRLYRAKWFSKIDLRDAFYSIRMAEGEEWKTAFRTRFGLYQYKVMPMGLTNAPASQQDLINETLKHLLDVTVLAYVDDLLIFTDGDLDQHIKDVQEVLSLLKKTDFKTAPEKCEFHKKEIEFLGFVIGIDGIKVDPKKTKSIIEWPIPKNVKDIQSFLGLVNYIRGHMPRMAHASMALTELTKKDVPFVWRNEQQQAFDKLKQIAKETTETKFFDPAKEGIIETDASDKAIGAVFTQEHNGKRMPIAFFSRKMTPAELNYDIHDKELLAIVVAIQQWRIYVEGATKTTIFTDHKNLLTFTTTKVLNRRQTRWAELLGQHKFEIKYTPGNNNGRADALSRRSDYMEGKDTVNHAILKLNKDKSLSPNTKEINAIEEVAQGNSEQFPIAERTKLTTDATQQACIKNHHDHQLYGHPGVTKTVQLIQRKFTFPRMRKKVNDYIKKCVPCQQNKASRHAKYGELTFRNPPNQPWNEVTMDFVTDLPESKGSTTIVYNAILVAVDRLTKYTYFIPCRKDFDAPQVAELVIDRIIRAHGVPRVFITDRDKIFTSNFWKTLVAELGIKHNLSTAFHPQTDGQTERANQTMEAYLRHYINHSQNDWVKKLPVAQLALNNHASETTGISPFFANYGRNPDLHLEPKDSVKSEAAITDATEMKKLHEILRDKITAQQTALKQNDKKQSPKLKKGDKVYLLTKNLKTRRQTKKLDHVKVGPFLIEEPRGPVSYKLQLPPDAKIHPVFHVSLLEPANAETPLQTTFHFETQEENEFEVERILKQKGQHFLVKWKGYGPEENTWEPLKNLKNCRQLLQQFRHQLQTR
jgi:transposase InsO family protein